MKERDREYYVIYVYSSTTSLLLSKLTEMNIPYVHFRDKFKVLSRYIFIPKEQKIEFNISLYGYYLTKVGMEEFATVSIKRMKKIIKGKDASNYVNNVVLINKGVFKHQYGKCERVRKDKCIISMYLFGGRKTKVVVPIDDVELVKANNARK